MKKSKRQLWEERWARRLERKKLPYHGNIKCDCGHVQKDHYQGSGWCHDSLHPKSGKCGCTWFHPNVKYIRSLKQKSTEFLISEYYDN